jgi:hypothetical protein
MPRAAWARVWTFVFINLPFEQTVNGDACHAASSARAQAFDKYKVGITIWAAAPPAAAALKRR